MTSAAPSKSSSAPPLPPPSGLPPTDKEESKDDFREAVQLLSDEPAIPESNEKEEKAIEELVQEAAADDRERANQEGAVSDGVDCCASFEDASLY